MEPGPESSGADAVPAKRVRKQTDKEFMYSGQQWGGPKPSRPSKASLAAAKAKAQQAAAVAAVTPVVPANPNVFIPPSVALSTYDKASQLVLSKDQLMCHGCEVSVVPVLTSESHVNLLFYGRVAFAW